MKYCSNCGTQMAEDIKFCTECGAKLERPVPPAEPAPEPAATPLPEPPAVPTYTPQVEPRGSTDPQPKPRREKKPGRKKRILLVAIAAILVLVLLGMQLGGNDPGSGEDLGRYEARSAKTDGGSVSVAGEWIELQKRGKAVLCILGSEFEAKWELDGEDFTLNQGGDTYTGTLKDGILRIDLAGTDYLFAGEGAAAEPVTYKAVSCVSHGQILDEELMDLIGGCYLVFNGDGSGMLHLFGETAPITYTDEAVTMDGETMPYTWKGDTMVLNLADGSSFDLEVTDENPAEATMSEFNWETGAWEETDMEAELMSYLQWPGQAFSPLDLRDATLSLSGTWGNATVWFKPGADGGSEVESMHFCVETGGYDELRELLVSAYGEPTDEGEEPYAASNGGAVAYCWFTHPAGALRLSAASERDYLEIRLSTD